jgi:non-heme chloroperoxidase
MHQPNGVEFATRRLATGPRLHYAERGDRTGEAIVFLHAYVDSWFTFSRILPLLSPEYHAFAPDERGHGNSDKPECCYTVNDFAAESTRSWTRSGSKRRPSSVLRQAA